MALERSRPACPVVVNADDFGASLGINRAVVAAHRSGPVTSASLMVNARAAADAAERAAELPELAVGIHVNFTNEGRHVVSLDDLAACRDELHRQLDAFSGMLGRPPTHVDSHHNVHIHHPALTELFLEAGRELGLPVRAFSPIRYVSRFYGRWGGETHPEQVTAASLLAIVDEEWSGGPFELACHPGYPDPEFISEYDGERQLELDALCSPEVAAGLAARDVALVSFADLARAGVA